MVQLKVRINSKKQLLQWQLANNFNSSFVTDRRKQKGLITEQSQYYVTIRYPLKYKIYDDI